MKRFSILLLAGIMLFAVFFYRFYLNSVQFAANPSELKNVLITIPKGSSAQSIALILEKEGLIKSPLVFKIYVRTHGIADDLQAGRFVFRRSMTLPQVVETLQKGMGQEMPVTFLEGWTATQMAQYLEEQGLTTADAFLDCLKTCALDFDFLPDGSKEGYLYPDTYFVDPSSYSDVAMIRRMIQTLENKLSSDDWRAVRASEYTFHEIMTMASIVEREERDPSEQPTVAGILWKRFDNGIGLGADATVLYALGRTSGGLTYQDLQIDSPYNTRKYRGLPPTPIANPGIFSIRAALYPKDSPYLYYLHDSLGGIHYAATLDEHNENKARYLR